jgi:polyribonucleotide nucleotidyltransferase
MMKRNGAKGNREEIPIPENKVGKIIGTKGQNIKRIQSESGALLKIFEREGSNFVSISGTPAEIELAKGLIFVMITPYNANLLAVYIPAATLGKTLEDSVKLVSYKGQAPDIIRAKILMYWTNISKSQVSISIISPISLKCTSE